MKRSKLSPHLDDIDDIGGSKSFSFPVSRSNLLGLLFNPAVHSSSAFPAGMHAKGKIVSCSLPSPPFVKYFVSVLTWWTRLATRLPMRLMGEGGPPWGCCRRYAFYPTVSVGETKNDSLAGVLQTNNGRWQGWTVDLKWQLRALHTCMAVRFRCMVNSHPCAISTSNNAHGCKDRCFGIFLSSLTSHTRSSITNYVHLDVLSVLLPVIRW